MKRCKHCHVEKPLADFYGDTAARDGHRPECKACTAARRKAWYEENREREIDRVTQWQKANPERVAANRARRRARPGVKLKEREGHLLRKYGITQADYDALLAKQRGGCAICGRKPTGKMSLHVDHDHSDDNRRIRGLLCFRCNNALGDLGDDVAHLGKAIAYLSQPTEEDLRIERLIRDRVQRELLRQQ